MALSAAPSRRNPVSWLSSLMAITKERGYRPGYPRVAFRQAFGSFPDAATTAKATADFQPLEEVLDWLEASAKKAGQTRHKQARAALDVVRQCAVCGEQFPPHRQTQVYCSPACWRQAGEPGTKPPQPDQARLRKILKAQQQ